MEKDPVVDRGQLLSGTTRRSLFIANDARCGQARGTPRNQTGLAFQTSAGGAGGKIKVDCCQHTAGVGFA
jgi:hypothetical protein